MRMKDLGDDLGALTSSVGIKTCLAIFNTILMSSRCLIIQAIGAKHNGCHSASLLWQFPCHRADVIFVNGQCITLGAPTRGAVIKPLTGSLRQSVLENHYAVFPISCRGGVTELTTRYKGGTRDSKRFPPSAKAKC